MLTEEQLKKRMKGIGGSDAAAVAGLNPYKSTVDVYLEKLGLKEAQAMNRNMYFGHALEPFVVSEYENITGKVCREEPNVLYHPKFEFMLANIDRRIEGENAILECKTTGNSFGWGESGTDQIPTIYLLQCAHYAMVCDVERVDIAVLINLSDFRIYHYYRNEELESKLMLKEEIFWNEHVLKEVPPTPTTYKEAVNLWKDELSDKTEIATPEIEKAYFELINKNKLINALQKESEELKGIICAHMQEASKLFSSNGDLLATWKTQNRKGYVVKPSSSRIFKLKEI